MPDPADDMDDEQELRRLNARAESGEPHLARLVQALEFLNAAVLDLYRKADAEALKHQARYRSLAFWSTLAGALAVLFVLLPLSGPSQLGVDAGAAACAGISLVIVIFALIAGTRETWLLERYRAERLRLEKFSALMDPHGWNDAQRDHWRSKLHGKIADLAMETEAALGAWTSNGTIPVAREAPPSIDPALAGEIRDYYRHKRLGVQLRYLRATFPQERKREKLTKHAGPILFYASVAVVFTRTVLDFGAPAAKAPWLNLVVFLAASLPAFAAAVRTHRAAREYGRNALRHEATYHTLRSLEARLAEEIAPDGIFRAMGFSEQVLEADTREWMRLMKEAEWFG